MRLVFCFRGCLVIGTRRSSPPPFLRDASSPPPFLRENGGGLGRSLRSSGLSTFRVKVESKF